VDDLSLSAKGAAEFGIKKIAANPRWTGSPLDQAGELVNGTQDIHATAYPLMRDPATADIPWTLKSKGIGSTLTDLAAKNESDADGEPVASLTDLSQPLSAMAARLNAAGQPRIDGNVARAQTTEQRVEKGQPAGRWALPADLTGTKANAPLPSSPATGDAVQTWNLQDLRVGLRETIASLSGTAGAAQTAGEQALDASGIQSTLAKTAAGQEARLGSRGDFAPQPATNAGTSLQWSAQPVADEFGQLRMPRMIEQVRQISEFLAERSEGVIRMGEGGVQANLRLHPAELGSVRVMLSVSNDHTVQTQFIVERAATAQLIQQHAPELQSILASHGLAVEQVRVTVQAPGAALPGDTSNWGGQTGGHRRNELDAQNQREQRSTGKDPNEPGSRNKREA
jgi:flagellar hook-length control protein FliK